MAQHHDLGVLRRLAAAQQKQPAKDPDQGEVQKSKRHRPRSFLITVGGPTRRSQMLLGVLERYTVLSGGDCLVSARIRERTPPDTSRGRPVDFPLSKAARPPA